MTDRNGSRHRVPHGSVRVQGLSTALSPEPAGSGGSGGGERGDDDGRAGAAARPSSSSRCAPVSRRVIGTDTVAVRRLTSSPSEVSTISGSDPRWALAARATTLARVRPVRCASTLSHSARAGASRTWVARVPPALLADAGWTGRGLRVGRAGGGELAAADGGVGTLWSPVGPAGRPGSLSSASISSRSPSKALLRRPIRCRPLSAVRGSAPSRRLPSVAEPLVRRPGCRSG